MKLLARLDRSARVVLVLGVLAVLGLWLPGRNEAHAQHEGSGAFSVGLVFDVGGRGDKSFNDSAYAGLVRAESELGVTGELLEPSGSEDREAGLRLFAAQKRDLVFAVGFIFSADVEAVARDYPDVQFACIDYAPTERGRPPNVTGIVFREEEGAFLVGAVAGMLSKTRHAGFVGGMTIPLIKKFEVGYAGGVATTCPTCRVSVGYAGSSPEAFKDPAKGKMIAMSQIAKGADVLFHAAGSTGLGVFEAAREQRVLAIGVDADQHDDMPGVVATSMVKRVDVAVFDLIRDTMVGHAPGGMRSFGLAEDGVDYVHEGPHAAHITPGIRQRVDALREDVISGRIRVPSR